MKKAMFLIAVVAVVVLAVPAVAMASGWNAVALPMASPHTGYTTGTNYCKVCHAVHEAENAGNTLNGERLLRSTVVGACDYCHVGGPIAATQVYNAVPANYAANTGAEHTLGLAKVAVDSNDAAGSANPANDYVIANFACTSCHSVHGAGTFAAGVNILKADPYGDGGAAANETQFCADCHTNNDVFVYDAVGGPDQVSHYMGAATLGVADAPSTTCDTCHNGGDGTQANNYPHLTSGDQFLQDTYDGNGNGGIELDAVCLSCHSGVGSDY